MKGIVWSKGREILAGRLPNRSKAVWGGSVTRSLSSVFVRNRFFE